MDEAVVWYEGGKAVVYVRSERVGEAMRELLRGKGNVGVGQYVRCAVDEAALLRLFGRWDAEQVPYRVVVNALPVL